MLNADAKHGAAYDLVPQIRVAFIVMKKPNTSLYNIKQYIYESKYT